MPIVQISIAAGKTDAQMKEMYKQVTDAMVKSLDVKPEAITIFVQEYEHTKIGKLGMTYQEFLQKQS